MGVKYICIQGSFALLGFLLLPNAARAEPYIPSTDEEVLETLSAAIENDSGPSSSGAKSDFNPAKSSAASSQAAEQANVIPQTQVLAEPSKGLAPDPTRSSATSDNR